MKEKVDTKFPEEFWKLWEEVRVCATLLREGKADIVTVTRKDGSIYRYTKLR